MRRRRTKISETPKQRRGNARLQRVPSSKQRGIEPQLDALEASGLIRLAQTQPELEYLFRHALLQDAAYGSLLKGDRRAQHRSVGDVLERLYPDRLDELAPVLALHFDEAGDDERAMTYYARAGDFALSRYANAEAVAHYTHALEASRRARTAQAQPLMHLFTQRGRALELSGQYEQALTNYQAMETQACERRDRVLELAALIARATIHSTPSAVHDPLRGKALSEQALTLARELADRRAESKILWNLMLLNQFTGHMHDAVGCGEQSLAIARELDLREQLAYTLNDSVRAYVGVGQFGRARLVLDEARDIWRALDNQPMLADNLGRSARIFFAVGEYERAIAAADEARRLSETIGNLWGQAFCRMFVGMVYFERGDLANAIETMSECIRLAAQAGLVMALVGTRADLAWVYGTLGAIEDGLEMGRLAQATAEKQLPVFRPWALSSQARLHVMRGDLAAAEACVTQARIGLELDDFSTHGAIYVRMAAAELAFAKDDYTSVVSAMDDTIARLRQVGMRSFFSDALYLKGRALLAQDQTDAASQSLNEARAEAEWLGSRRMLWQILAALSAIEERRGHSPESQQLRSQARELIAYIASHIPTKELRESFLQGPLVRALVDAP